MSTQKHLLILDRNGLDVYEIDEIKSQEKIFVTAITNRAFEKSNSVAGFDQIHTAELNDASRLPELLYLVMHINAKRRITHIVTCTERLVEVAAGLREALGLPGLILPHALIFRDKYLMKKHFSAQGIPVAAYWTHDEASNIDREKYPLVVIKPRSSMGSEGVYCTDTSEITDKNISDNEMIEEFIEGELHHIDVISQNKKILFLATFKYLQSQISPKDLLFNGGIELSGTEEVIFLDFCTSIVEKSGLTDSVFHIEVFLTKTGLVLNEIAARPAGSGIGATLTKAKQVNLFRIAAELEIGLPIRLSKNANDLCAWLVLYPKKGVLKKCSVINPPNNLLDWNLIKKIGSRTVTPTMSGDILANFSFSTAEASEADISGFISKCITVEYEAQ